MNCWRWAGVVFNGAEALDVVGTVGVAVAGAAAAIAAIIYGALTSCAAQSIVIGLACWFLFESGLFVLSGVMSSRKAKETASLRRENARLSTELHACRGRLMTGPPSSVGVSDGEASDELDSAEWGMAPVPGGGAARDEDLALAVEALEANNRGLSAERVGLRRRIQALEDQNRGLEDQNRVLAQEGEGVATHYRHLRRRVVELLQLLAKEPGLTGLALASAALSPRAPEEEAGLITSALKLAVSALEERVLWEEVEQEAAQRIASGGSGGDGK